MASVTSCTKCNRYLKEKTKILEENSKLKEMLSKFWSWLSEMPSDWLDIEKVLENRLPEKNAENDSTIPGEMDQEHIKELSVLDKQCRNGKETDMVVVNVDQCNVESIDTDPTDQELSNIEEIDTDQEHANKDNRNLPTDDNSPEQPLTLEIEIEEDPLLSLLPMQDIVKLEPEFIETDPLEEANAGVQGINMFKQECLEKEDTKIGYQKKTGKNSKETAKKHQCPHCGRLLLSAKSLEIHAKQHEKSTFEWRNGRRKIGRYIWWCKTHSNGWHEKQESFLTRCFQCQLVRKCALCRDEDIFFKWRYQVGIHFKKIHPDADEEPQSNTSKIELRNMSHNLPPPRLEPAITNHNESPPFLDPTDTISNELSPPHLVQTIPYSPSPPHLEGKNTMSNELSPHLDPTISNEPSPPHLYPSTTVLNEPLPPQLYPSKPNEPLPPHLDPIPNEPSLPQLDPPVLIPYS